MTALGEALARRRLSVSEMAELLERHIGDGRDPCACAEADRALQRIRTHFPGYYLRAALRHLDGAEDACGRVRRVIAALREWQHFSGA